MKALTTGMNCFRDLLFGFDMLSSKELAFMLNEMSFNNFEFQEFPCFD